MNPLQEALEDYHTKDGSQISENGQRLISLPNTEAKIIIFDATEPSQQKSLPSPIDFCIFILTKPEDITQIESQYTEHLSYILHKVVLISDFTQDGQPEDEEQTKTELVSKANEFAAKISASFYGEDLDKAIEFAYKLDGKFVELARKVFE